MWSGKQERRCRSVGKLAFSQPERERRNEAESEMSVKVKVTHWNIILRILLNIG
jgi:hypothetical protein